MRAELLALLAAVAWAVGSLFSAPASSHLGAIAFTRWRLLFAGLMLWFYVLSSGAWRTLGVPALGVLALSGLVGIFVGDTALFACMNRLGPRRSGVLFASHAAFSAVLAWLLLGETLTGWTLLGALLIMVGVMIAIAWGRREGEDHVWENTQGPVWVGIALGLVAAAAQAVATLMLKPLMGTGLDATAASAVRLSAALLAHGVLWASGFEAARSLAPANRSALVNTFWSAAIAMALGMTLVLQALKTGQANLVGIFSSVTPVVLLPLLWGVYRRRPAVGAWIGGGLAVVGAATVLAR